ncbi:60S ribosomal protein L37-like [Apodemus sylvaticus]|uniref:60S ribosomal protein L37-like n=1 Tax=Apodemus sylvaticus TaxID=10129 RepID=UPI00224471A0|nr:60S ribosomal protein L37-like [Apodemus sylvaticus]
MMKGTSSFGKHCNEKPTLSLRCSSKAFRSQPVPPGKHKRKYNWSAKAKRQNITRTGQMRHLRIVYRRFRHGF